MRADQRTQTFLVVWVAGIIAHQLAFPEELWSGVTGLISLAVATVATLWPGSLHRYLAALAASSIYTAARLPAVPNHEVLDLVLQVGLLLAWIPLLLRRRPLSAAPLRLVRGGFLAIYLWAAFAKLNTSYLDPAVSCSRFVLDALHGRLPLIATHDFVVWLGIVGTYLFEFGIPIGLIFSRTRRATIVLGIGFHTFLAFVPIPGVASFSVLMMAGYVAFVPEAWIDIICDAHARWWPHVARQWGRIRIAVIAVIVIAAEIARRAPDLERALDQLAVTVAGGVLFVIAVVVWREELRDPTRSDAPMVARPVTPTSYQQLVIVVGVVLIGLNGLLPYLGGRTQTSFTMFSNLRTEGSSNHLVFGGADILDTQDRLVSVLSSNQWQFDTVIGPGLVVPAAEVGRRLAELDESEVTLTVAIDGETLVLDDEAARRRFPASSWLDRRFVIARPVEAVGPVACRH